MYSILLYSMLYNYSIYATGKLRNQAFHEMPKNFSHCLK